MHNVIRIIFDILQNLDSLLLLRSLYSRWYNNGNCYRTFNNSSLVHSAILQSVQIYNSFIVFLWIDLFGCIFVEAYKLHISWSTFSILFILKLYFMICLNTIVHLRIENVYFILYLYYLWKRNFYSERLLYS